MNEWMDQWMMNGIDWEIRSTNEFNRHDRWMDGQINGYGLMNEWMHGLVKEWMNTMDRWMNERMNKWMDW